MKRVGFYLILLGWGALSAHNGHGDGVDPWIKWMGNYHLVILHFPIALIVMTLVAEVLYKLTKRDLFDHAAEFMIKAAAFFGVPTALLGLAYSVGMPDNNYLVWHQFFGITTALLAILTAILRGIPERKGYMISLILLFFIVLFTAYLGGEMAFGVGNLLPPI